MADQTIRPTDLNNDNSSKTIRPQNVDDATVRPGGTGGADDATVRPQGTIGAKSDKTLKGQQKEIARLSAEYEKEYILDGVKYKFIEALSEGTGEANLLLVENGGKKYVLKLYYVGIPLPDTQILEAVKSTKGQLGMVELIKYGEWVQEFKSSSGLSGSSEKRAYELMAYCEGGSLAHYDIGGDEQKLKKVAVMMAMCIHACHEKGFLHCDVKPANFLFVDKAQTRLVISDFGISVRYDQDGIAHPTSEARTRIYAAPEFYYSVPGQARALSKSSDFYSLGMSLLCLWMGEDAFMQQEAELLRLKIGGKLPYPQELSDHTQSLLRALTTVHEASRPTFAQIAEWAKGDNPFAQFKPTANETISSFEIVFNAGKNQIAHSPKELAAFMRSDMALAEKYLYSGKISQWLRDNLRPELEVQMEEIVETKFPSDKRDGVFAACMVLDPTIPFVYTDKDGTQIACQTLQDVIDAAREHTASDDTWKEITRPTFLMWVGLRDKSVEARIRHVMQGFTPMPGAYTWGVLYCLHRGVNYHLDWNQNEYYTYQHIGQYLNQMVDCVLNPDKYSADEQDRFRTLFNRLNPNINGTRLYFYLKSKGSYDPWIQWIEFCFDLDSKDNTKKPAPYNRFVAAYKCIKGMGCDPIYYTKSGTALSKPADVKKLSRTEREYETSDDRALKEWLTVFYEEDPSLDLSKKYTFEKKTEQYIQFLASINPNLDEVKRYAYASGMVNDALSRAKRKYAHMMAIRVLLAVLCFVPVVALVIALLVLGLPFDSNILSGHFWGFTWVLAAILFIPICVLSDLKGDLIGEAIVSLVAGAVLYGILSVVLAFLIAFAPYIISALLLTACGFIIKKCYIDYPLKAATMKALTNGTRFEDTVVQPLYYTFRPRLSFDSPVIDDANSYAEYLTTALKQLLRWAVPTILVTAGLFIMMIMMTPRMMTKQAISNAHIPYMQATWKGTFGGENAALEINQASPKKVDALLFVKFKTINSGAYEGTINVGKRTMSLRCTDPQNAVFGKSSIYCTFTDETYSSLTGTYRNPSKNSEYALSLSREMSPEEADIRPQSTWEVWKTIFKKKLHIHS